MKSLEKIGMKKNWIYEVVVSTFHGQKPHAAPIGVWTEDFDILNMAIYKDSKTLKNIIRLKACAANCVSDISIFYAALFDKEKIAFEKSKKVNAPIVKGSAAAMELEVQNIIEGKNRFHIAAEIVEMSVRGDVELINRAKPLLLESLILSTRISYMNTSEAKRAFEENYRVIKKVAPDSEYQTIMEEISIKFGLKS